MLMTQGPGTSESAVRGSVLVGCFFLKFATCLQFIMKMCFYLNFSLHSKLL